MHKVSFIASGVALPMSSYILLQVKHIPSLIFLNSIFTKQSEVLKYKNVKTKIN